METTMGNRIATLRRKKELKQDELAEMLGVSPQAVSKWENDQSCPDISLLPKLSHILGVTVDELLTGESAQSASVRMLPPEQRKDIKDMMLRVIVESAEGDKVRVNLPFALVQAAADMGIQIPQINGNEVLKDIDLSQILNLVQHGAVGNLVEVDSAEGHMVRIIVE